MAKGKKGPTDDERYEICQGGRIPNALYDPAFTSIPVRPSIVDKKFKESATDKIKTAVKSFESLKDYKPSSATIDNYHWYQRYLMVAKTYAGFSKDPSTQTGAVIVDSQRRIVSAGFNGFPIGIADTEERLNNRELKLKLILHAEEGALMASKQDLTGCTIFVYPLPPCNRCSLLIIQSGITKVVAPKLVGGLLDRWGESVKISRELFKEAKVELIEI